MPPSSEFGALLTEAIYRILSIEGRGTSIQIVQDELGYAIGRESAGSAIEHWRKGYAPAQHQDVEALAREIVRRTDLGRRWVERFLRYGRHPDPARLMHELCPAAAGAKPAASAPIVPADEPAPAPFIAGPPITQPRSFFGRDTVVRRIFDMLRRVPLQNSAVIGPRRSGKTSLLHYLRTITTTPAAQLRATQRHDWLPTPTHYHWVLVDFQDPRLRRREGLLRFLLDQLRIPAPEPCTLERFLDAMDAGVHEPTVLLFDEIGRALQSCPELDDELWESLRALGPQVGGKLGFVLTAHVTPAALAQDSGHSSPFFNIFGYSATLGPFSEAEARELIAAAPLPFAERDSAWIIEQSRGWPIVLQTLCRERLLSLEAASVGDGWRDEALRQIAPYGAML